MTINIQTTVSEDPGKPLPRTPVGSDRAGGSPPATAGRNSGMILVGGPNAGKSVIFGLLTGRYATVSNYPGTTVEVARGRVKAGGSNLVVVDTPGINSLLPRSEDEQVTRDILMSDEGTIVQVADAKNLSRAISLSFQLAEAGRQFILLLNMSDEAEHAGIDVDASALSKLAGVPVLQTVAIRKKGTRQILPAAMRAERSRLSLQYYGGIEEALVDLEPLLPRSAISNRAVGLMVLAGDDSLALWLHEHLREEQVARIENIRHRLQKRFHKPLAFVINEHRMRAAKSLATEVTRRQSRKIGNLSGVLDSVTMHPVWSVPILAAVLATVFLFVGWLGAGTGVDLLETHLFGKSMATLTLKVDPSGELEAIPISGGAERRFRIVSTPAQGATGLLHVLLEEKNQEAGSAQGIHWSPLSGEQIQVFAGESLRPLAGAHQEIRPGVFAVHVPEGSSDLEFRNWTGFINPTVYRLSRAYFPAEWLVEIVAGQYGLISMGLTYAVAIILPIIVTFFLAFSILEDSGYLPRLAVVFNRLLRTIGLNGKAVLPLILGLGCDTMATLTTRILATRKERLIAILLLALGIPCSAQLGVMLGLLAGLSWKATLLWMAVVAGTILFVGFIASRILPGDGSDFIMEIPPLRLPSASNIGLKTLSRVEWYLKEAVPIFLIGTIILFVADKTGSLAVARQFLEPVVVGILDLPAETTDAFIIGFLRRDFGAAGLFVLAEEGLLTPAQILVSVVTMTLFIPCVANFLMIIKERGLVTAILVASFIFPFAVLVGGGLSFALRSLQVQL